MIGAGLVRRASWSAEVSCFVGQGEGQARAPWGKGRVGWEGIEQVRASNSRKRAGEGSWLKGQLGDRDFLPRDTGEPSRSLNEG